METLVIHIKNKEDSVLIKKFLKGLGIEFYVQKEKPEKNSQKSKN